MDIKVERSNRRTLVLTLDSSGVPLVRAPLNTPDKEVEAFVARHSLWLQRRLARFHPLPTLQDGEILMLFGSSRVVRTGETRLTATEVYLPETNREEALRGILRRYSADRMCRMTSKIASAYKFRYQFAQIGSARGRWGSCSAKGWIIYSFRTGFLPDDIALYIVVHELCHTRQMNHSAAFWREVERVLPDYAARRKALRDYEWVMKWL